MHSGAFAVAVGSLLAAGFYLDAAVADEPAPAIENGFFTEADPVEADDLEEVFTRDLQYQGIVVRYTDGTVTVYQPEPKANATDATSAEAAPETTVGTMSALPTGILTGDDIRTHVVGNTSTRFVRGSWRTEYYAPDGTIAGRWRNLPIEGRWAVRDEAMCFDYDDSRRDFCARMSLEEATLSLYTADGVRYNSTLSLLPGNPGNL